MWKPLQKDRACAQDYRLAAGLWQIKILEMFWQLIVTGSQPDRGRCFGSFGFIATGQCCIRRFGERVRKYAVVARRQKSISFADGASERLARSKEI